MWLNGPSARGQIVLTYCWWRKGKRDRKRDRGRETKRDRNRGAEMGKMHRLTVKISWILK